METETKRRHLAAVTHADVQRVMDLHPSSPETIQLQDREDAQAALLATPAADLLTKAYELTHRMHGLRRAEARDLRAARDMITAELIRRAGA